VSRHSNIPSQSRGSVAQIEGSPAPVPRRSNGILWGCVGSLLVVAALVGGLLLYGGWFFLDGFKNDRDLETALAVVRGNPVAHAVLGDSIAIEGMESETFSAATGSGKTVSYTVRLKGNRAQGQLHVMLHSAGGDMKIVSMVLTGPDNARYNLTSPEAAAPSNSI
jgi:hypothetical protein